MKNKSEALGNLLIGILFLVVGALLLSMGSGMLLVTLVVIADLLLGAVLLICGIAGMVKRSPAEQPAEVPEDDWSNAAVSEQQEEPAEEVWDEPVQHEEKPAAEDNVQVLTAREAELRKLVKQRRAEARQAADDADQAGAAAAAAEQALVEAENAMKYVSDDQKRAYLSKIDRLADDAMDKSQQAVFAARRAKVAEKALADAIAQHRLAMDAAAEAMMAAEEAEWGSN